MECCGSTAHAKALNRQCCGEKYYNVSLRCLDLHASLGALTWLTPHLPPTHIFSTSLRPTPVSVPVVRGKKLRWWCSLRFYSTHQCCLWYVRLRQREIAVRGGLLLSQVRRIVLCCEPDDCCNTGYCRLRYVIDAKRECESEGPLSFSFFTPQRSISHPCRCRHGLCIAKGKATESLPCVL